jgi:hypothetical protein
MTYEEFKEKFLDSLERNRPAGYSIRITPAEDGRKECVSVIPKGKEKSIYPLIEIEAFYKDYFALNQDMKHLTESVLELFEDLWKEAPTECPVCGNMGNITLLN